MKSISYFFFTCIFHTCVYVLVKRYRNIQVNSVVLLSTLATDRYIVVRLNLFLLGNVIVMGRFCKL